MTTPRPIRPHKGGRTARAPEARIRPQTLERIHEAMREQDKTFADLLEETYQGEGTMSSVSVKKAGDIDATNAYYVSVNGEILTVHTNERGRGLWVDGKQREGTMQFNVGKNPAAAIRKYFEKYG